MKKNLKFLISAIISIISLSTIATSAMQNIHNNPENSDIEFKYKKYDLNTILKNFNEAIKEQSNNSNISEKNIYKGLEEVEKKIKSEKNNPFQMTPSKIQEYLGEIKNIQQPQNNNFDNKIKKDKKINNSNNSNKNFNKIPKNKLKPNTNKFKKNKIKDAKKEYSDMIKEYEKVEDIVNNINYFEKPSVVPDNILNELKETELNEEEKYIKKEAEMIKNSLINKYKDQFEKNMKFQKY